MVLSILCQSSSFPISRGEHRQKAEVWPEKVISFRCDAPHTLSLAYPELFIHASQALHCDAESCEGWEGGGGGDTRFLPSPCVFVSAFV